MQRKLLKTYIKNFLLKMYFKKVIAIFISVLKLIIELLSIIFYNLLFEYTGGFVIWCIKGFKTSLKEEINNDYESGQPYYKKFMTPHFIGFLVFLIFLFIIGILITN